MTNQKDTTRTNVLWLDPVLAGILSFIVPGLGQVYSGRVFRGVVLFIGYYFLVGICLAIDPLLLIFALFAIIWCILDAVEMARLYNKRLV
jgi:TM2 domain-containing membrane protein YozV